MYAACLKLLLWEFINYKLLLRPPQLQVTNTFLKFSLFLAVDAPKITQHPESQSVVTGTTIAFTVEATGDDLQFLWQKDGKDIYKNESQLQCSQTDNSSTLRIQHVKKSDQGHYKCIVENPVGMSEKTSDEAELTVREFFYLAFWVCVHGADYRILIPFW